MKLSEKKGGDFQPHPATDSPVKGVIVDITPLKKRMTAFGEKEEFRIIYETEVVDEENDRRFCVWSRGYTASLNEKAAIRKDLKKILGRDLTKAELEEFDLEALIGHGVKLIIIHEERDDKVYANIAFIAPDKEDALKPSGKYVRVKDREQKAVSGEQAGYRKAPAAAEDEGRADWQKVKVHVGKHAGVDMGDLDADAVQALIEKWLPQHKANAKPKADDKRLAAALEEVAELLGVGAAESDF
jgi:hypothetical protein